MLIIVVRSLLAVVVLVPVGNRVEEATQAGEMYSRLRDEYESAEGECRRRRRRFPVGETLQTVVSQPSETSWGGSRGLVRGVVGGGGIVRGRIV